jgi:hypothetical protein
MPPEQQQIKKYRVGLGLLETVVGMTLLVVGIVSLMSMVMASARGRNANEMETVAANLAREGLEAVVWRRNDNWINDRDFDDGLELILVDPDYTFVPVFDATTNTWTMLNDLSHFTIDKFRDNAARLYRYPSGLMVQAQTQPSGTVSSPYSRLVTADPICFDGATETIVTSGSVCGSGTAKIGMRVTSAVRWIDHDIAHTTSAVETLYDWR